MTTWTKEVVDLSIASSALTIDSIRIDGANIGHADDTDLLLLANGALTIDGTASISGLITATSGVKLGNNIIYASDGGSTITLDNSDNVTILGDLTVTGGDLTLGSVNYLSDSGGTGTLKNIDAIDATTEATIEAAMDTLPNVTSVGTLTTLTVDNVIVNGTTIGHTSDTDLMTLASGALTVAGTLTSTGIVDITDTTDSSNASGDTGALRCEGGASIAKKLYVGTDLDVDGATTLDAVDIDGNVQLDGTLIVGVDDTGYDVKFFGATSGQYLHWNQSTDELLLSGDSKLSFHDAAGGENIIATSDGHLEINAGTTLDITAPTVDINAATTLNIDGTTQLNNTLTVGVNDTGYDVKFFGASNGSYLEWDQSEDKLRIVDAGDGTSTNPKIELWRNSPSPATNDSLGELTFFGEDSAGTKTEYASIKGKIEEVNATTKEGGIYFDLLCANSTTNSSDIVTGFKMVGAVDDETGVYKANFWIQNGDLHVRSTETDSAREPYIYCRREQGSGNAGDDDNLGGLIFEGDDADGNSTAFGALVCNSTVVTAGQERGIVRLKAAEYDGTNTTGLELEGTTVNGIVDATIGGGTTSKTKIKGYFAANNQTPAAAPDWTVSNKSGTSRSLDADGNIAAIGDNLAQLVDDLISIGILQ